jgi:hypothetical protein
MFVVDKYFPAVNGIGLNTVPIPTLVGLNTVRIPYLSVYFD